MKTSTAKREEGMALLISIIFLVVMGLLATYIVTRVISHTNQVTHHIDHLEAFQGIEAANAQVEAEVANANDLALLITERDGFIGLDPTYDFSTLGLPDWGTAGVAPVTLASNGELQLFAYSLDWGTDGLDNNGDGVIDDPVEASGFSSVISHARIFRNGQTVVARRSEQLFGAGVAISVWQNAIFAGGGQTGALINGNVSIHGSVHLLGDTLDPNDPAISALDLSGTSMIHNNYEGLSADLRARIASLPQILLNGEMVDTLSAYLRVKNGLVAMSGNSEVGEADIFGNAYKETMDGVYVTDGWSGNDIDVNGDPQSVYSDNGWDNAYDLGNGIDFPTYDNDGGRDHLAYYLETDPNPNVGLHYVHNGDLTIEPGNGSVYWNATTGDLVNGGTPGDGNMPLPADLNPGEYYVWFDDSTDTMMINGRIPVDGNIDLLAGSGASNKQIDYEGKGSLLAFESGGSGTADVSVEVSLKTTGFPNTNLIGLHAEDHFLIGANSQLEMMGGFYSQGTIEVDKQSTILGSIVGDFFNMGGQVPDIYQVPALELAWEDIMRMIGANPGATTQPLAWWERNVL